MNRRRFVTVGSSLLAGSGLVESPAFAAPKLAVPEGRIGLDLPKLPYPPEALEPHIDALTMSIHHDKHHQAYVTKLKEALTAAKLDAPDLDILGLIKEIGNLPKESQTAIRNNGGGHVNHTWFWNWMAPANSGPKGPKGKLADAIQAQFGSVDAMKKALDDAAAKRFGSGWAWLIKKADGKLAIVSTPNQDNPLMKGVVSDADLGIPVLGIDVWEHAYYLKHQNKRPEYLAAWWNVVNWAGVSKGYDKAV